MYNTYSSAKFRGNNDLQLNSATGTFSTQLSHIISLKVSSVNVDYVHHLYEHGTNKFCIQIVEACKPYTMTCHWLRLALTAVTHTLHTVQSIYPGSA